MNAICLKLGFQEPTFSLCHSDLQPSAVDNEWETDFVHSWNVSLKDVLGIAIDYIATIFKQLFIQLYIDMASEMGQTHLSRL